MRRAFLPDTAGIFGLTAFLVLSGYAGKKALLDGDTLWHIKFGTLMLESGELVTHDTFSHTAYGYPWLAHEWLSEIIMAGLYKWAGLPGVALFYFAIAGLTFSLLINIASRLAGDGPALLAGIVALPFAMIHLLARPHIFTWLGTALTLFLVVRGGRCLWWLIPLNIVWANLHGGVLFGLVIQGVFIIGRLLDEFQRTTEPFVLSCWCNYRWSVIMMFLSAAAVCINPFGYKLYFFPFKVASPVFVQQISEWKPPDLRAMWYLRLWIVALLVSAAWTGRKVDWAWRLLAVFLMWEILGHIRHASLAALLLIPYSALVLRDLVSNCHFLSNWQRRRAATAGPQLELSSCSGPWLTVLCCLAAILLTAKVPTGLQPLIYSRFPMPEAFSQDAIDFLKRGFPGERLLNHYEWGDYLLFALDPPPKVFIDGRADMYGEKILSDYVAMSEFSGNTDSLLARYGIDWVLFPSEHLLPRILALRPEWCTLYSDNQVSILRRVPEMKP